MRPGEIYVLHGSRRTKITVLDTPPELRRRARVRVRLESGIKAGEVTDVPSVRIVPLRGAPKTPEEPSRPRRTRPFAVERTPEVGDSVTWNETGPLVWSLDEFDEETGQATISGVIFEQPATRTVSIDQLQVCAEDPKPFAAPIVEGPDNPRTPPASRDIGVQPTEHLRPITPRRALDELLDDVLFSPACLAAYGRRYAAGVSGAALNERLREEIRRKGFIMRRGLPGGDEYARLRVPRRFDVVLKARPTPESPVTVNELHFPAGSKKGGRGQNRQAGRRRPAA
jgi:hypothetical protein